MSVFRHCNALAEAFSEGKLISRNVNFDTNESEEWNKRQRISSQKGMRDKDRDELRVYVCSCFTAYYILNGSW